MKDNDSSIIAVLILLAGFTFGFTVSLFVLDSHYEAKYYRKLLENNCILTKGTE